MSHIERALELIAELDSLDREKIAAIFYLTRFPHRAGCFNAPRVDLEVAYIQADAVLRLYAEDGTDPQTTPSTRSPNDPA